MVHLRKIMAVILAFVMIFSISVSTAYASNLIKEGIIATKVFGNTGLLTKGASAIGSLIGISAVEDLFTSKNECPMPSLPLSDIVANVKKGVEGTGLIYGRDYKIECEDDSTYGYRIHLIQPVSGTTIFDNYLLYKDGKWVWEKAWNIPTLPTCEDFSIKNIKNNIYTALWDSGIYIDVDKDISVTRTSQDGFKVLIIDPITGREIYKNEFIIEDSKTIDWNLEFEPISEDSVITAHFPTTEEAQEDIIEPSVTPSDNEESITVVEEVIDNTVLDDVTPLGEAPVAGTTEIANTGDTAFVAMGTVCVMAAAAYVASKKVK